jgi:hypothetical protein
MCSQAINVNGVAKGGKGSAEQKGLKRPTPSDDGQPAPKQAAPKQAAPKKAAPKEAAQPAKRACNKYPSKGNALLVAS